MFASAAALACWYQAKAERHLERSSPASILTLAAVVIAVVVIVSRSRGSILNLVVFIGAFTGIYLWRHFSRPKQMRTVGGRFVLALVLVGFTGTCLMSIRMDRIWKRFADLASDRGASLQSRTMVRQATSEMLADRWLFGWGAGCFRYGFPIYAQKYPVLCYRDSRRLFWEHAHNDLLEYPVELGAVGTMPIAALLGCAAVALVRRRFWQNAVTTLLVVGCFLTLLHAGMDFVFQNPAVLLTWSVLLLAAIRLHTRSTARFQTN
jgi:O-antigen ligase